MTLAMAAVILLSTIIAGMVLLTTVDPVLVTEVSVVFWALALPLTYLPILIVANDPGYMGSDGTGGSRGPSTPSSS
jgi:hypothetical protein